MPILNDAVACNHSFLRCGPQKTPRLDLLQTSQQLHIKWSR